MRVNRRTFLKRLAGTGSLAIIGGTAKAHAKDSSASLQENLGVLVDTTLCIGCRSCEQACNLINQDLPRRSPQDFKDYAVFDAERRMDGNTYTVVNRYQNSTNTDKPVYVKFRCMHCRYPACMSACIVGAFSREPNGAVIYDAWKCIGCRYCMAACPFQVPGYEYDDAFTPEVRKCTFCFDERLSKGEVPACVQVCPVEVMTFGKRSELLMLAKERIRKHPDRYQPHIYGEHELGGTSWLYLSSVPFQHLGLPNFGYKPIPGYTEPIQHAVFKYFIPPFALYGLLGGFMWFLKSKKSTSKPALGEKGVNQ